MWNQILLYEFLKRDSKDLLNKAENSLWNFFKSVVETTIFLAVSLYIIGFISGIGFIAYHLIK